MQITSFMCRKLLSLLFHYFSTLISLTARFSKKKKSLPVVRLALPFFSALSHKRRDFTKKKCKNLCFDFLFNFLENISHSKQNSPRFTINLLRASFNVAVILVRFYWNWNFLGIFSENSYIKCNENKPNGIRVVPYGRTDRHDEDTSLFRVKRVLWVRLTTHHPTAKWSYCLT